MSHLEVLESELRRFEIELPPSQIAALARYCDELTRWNPKINLTGLRDSEMVRRLVVEPVWIGQQLKMTGVLLDIGSGNGSPAIPLHIISPLARVHLVEARAKRAAFLRHITGVLQLKDATVYNARFEHIAATVGPVDWVTLQAVALTEGLVTAIRTIAQPTTTVVWITSSRTTPPLAPTGRLHVHLTDSEVLLFRLDHS